MTGALAASYYGNPRTTADADIVVQVKPSGYRKIVKVAEEAGLKVDDRQVLASLKSGYNLIQLRDKSSIYQADFILQSKGRLERRRGTLLGLKAYYQTPERLVLSKLRMVKATVPWERSLDDREDIRVILQDPDVDRRKIARLAKAESTFETLRKLESKMVRTGGGKGVKAPRAKTHA